MIYEFTFYSLEGAKTLNKKLLADSLIEAYLKADNYLQQIGYDDWTLVSHGDVRMKPEKPQAVYVPVTKQEIEAINYDSDVANNKGWFSSPHGWLKPLLNSEQEDKRSVANTPNSSTDADNINTSSNSKEQEQDVEALAFTRDQLVDLVYLAKRSSELAAPFVDDFLAAQKKLTSK
jgi:hypothetical protein